MLPLVNFCFCCLCFDGKSKKKKKNAKADVKEPMAYVFLLGERRTYGNFFYHKLINHIYVDLFLGSLFCFIDLWSVFYASTISF